MKIHRHTINCWESTDFGTDIYHHCGYLDGLEAVMLLLADQESA